MKIKRICLSIALTLLAGAALAQTTSSPFKTPLEATGYAVGVDMVRNFKSQGVAFDIEQLIHGLRDANSGAIYVQRLPRELEVRYLLYLVEPAARFFMPTCMKKRFFMSIKFCNLF